MSQLAAVFAFRSLFCAEREDRRVRELLTGGNWGLLARIYTYGCISYMSWKGGKGPGLKAPRIRSVSGG